MTNRYPASSFAAAAVLAVLAVTTGCQHYHQAKMLYQPPPPVAPLGTVSDPIWQSQEARAEASEFVIYQHEFGFQNAELNSCGMNHVTQVAARLKYCPHLPVIIEPSNMTVRENTDFQYPVHPNPELDLRRRRHRRHRICRRELAVLPLGRFAVAAVLFGRPGAGFSPCEDRRHRGLR